jgi:lysophospholipase L1-like esterase
VTFWAIVGVAVIGGVAGAAVVGFRGDSNDSGDSGVLHHPVYVLGDSYSISDDPWYQTTADELDGAEIEVAFTVDAVGGTGYATGVGTSFADRVATSAPANAELAIVFGGGDDIDQAPDAVYDAATKVYTQIYASAPSAAILVVGPSWPTADVPQRLLAVRDAIARAASDADAVFYDPIAEGWFTGDAAVLIGPDGVHPTADGQAYMGDLIEPQVRQFFAS